MASSKEYLNFVLDQLSGLDGIGHRTMMGEFILYYNGKVVGGIYDNRLLMKPTAAAIAYMPTATLETPYEGTREMLFVDNIDDKDYLIGLFHAIGGEGNKS